MKKFLFRTAVLLVVFILALLFFYKRVERHSYSDTVMTVTASESVLPMISFVVNENEINLTKGYTVAQDDKLPRESITPVSTAGEFSIIIDQKKSTVKKLTAEVFGIPDLTLYSQTNVNTFTTLEDGRLSTDIAIEGELMENVEYLLKVTLTDSLGDQIYYYSRIQVTTFGSLSGSMEFLHNFHESTFDKEKVYELADVMEEDDDAVINDYSHIDITSSMDALSYGEMSPTEVYQIVPLISEYNETYASVSLEFWIQAYTDDGLETYECTEKFRFQYSSYKIFLYNYDRYMNAVFDGNYFELNDKLVKLGVSESDNIAGLETLYSDDGNQMLFDYQGTIWQLDAAAGRLTEVITYRDEEDYDRGYKEDYGYKLLSIDDDGNADFAVCGYIGKGVYEGRTGIIYYRYYAADSRLEEKMFIPLNIPYCDVEGEFGRVSYTSDYDIYYFTLFNTYYSYELDTNVLSVVIEDMGDDWIYFEDENIICYDETPVSSGDDKAEFNNGRIVLLDIVNQTSTYIDADEGMLIKLLGTIDGRIVYGNADGSRLSFFDDGNLFIPYNKISIADIDTSIVKEYVPGQDLYVGSVSFKSGVIGFDLYSLESEPEGSSKASYTYRDSDVIIDLNSGETTSTGSCSSVNNDITKLEYYLKLPSSLNVEQSPKLFTTKSTVITKDTTVIIKTVLPDYYYVTAYGKIVLSTESLSEAVSAADSAFGSVVDVNGNAIWQRGVVSESNTISGLEISYVNDSRNAGQAALQMMMSFFGADGAATDCDMKEQSLYDWFDEKLSCNVAIAENAKLAELLYFVSKGRPIVVTYNNYYVVITAYTEGTVTFVDPVTGEKKKMTKEKAQTAFEEAGGVYYVFY